MSGQTTHIRHICTIVPLNGLGMTTKKYTSATCTLYQGASAPRHPRQRDVRRTSKQRGRLARSCCRRLLRCKSPLGCLLIACDPDRGCQRQLTGVKTAAKKKPGGQPSLFLCLLQAKQIYLLSAVATSTAQATVQPTIGLLPMPSQLLRTVRQSAYGPWCRS